jgi:hypothetical protein
MRFSIYRIHAPDGALLWVGMSQLVERRIAQHRRKPWFVAGTTVTVEEFALSVLGSRNLDSNASSPPNKIALATMREHGRPFCRGSRRSVHDHAERAPRLFRQLHRRLHRRQVRARLRLRPTRQPGGVTRTRP